MLSLARKRSKRTVADERITYKVFDFSWSFSPLFNWLRLFGIALNESTEPVNIQKNLSQGFYILVPICTLAARIYTILDTTCQLISFSTLKTQGVATEITTTLLWSQSLRLLTQHLALITSQIAIFIVSFSRWGLLVSCFRRLERSMKIGRTCYIQLRRACTIGLLWLLLVPHCIFLSYIFKFSAVVFSFFFINWLTSSWKTIDVFCRNWVLLYTLSLSWFKNQLVSTGNYRTRWIVLVDWELPAPSFYSPAFAGFRLQLFNFL